MLNRKENYIIDFLIIYSINNILKVLLINNQLLNILIYKYTKYLINIIKYFFVENIIF